MRPVVVDTDVVSFLFKNDSRAQAYLPHLRDRQWLISFMTEAELEQWALLSNWHASRIDWLRIFVGRFATVPSSRDLVLKWAEVMVATPGNCRCLDSIDGHCVRCSPLTHDANDYSGVAGLKVITESSQ